MVIGEPTANSGEAMPPPQQQFTPQKATIENIMSGIENTGTVKMNNHRKKLRQRFDIIKKLGQGTYGKVQLGINKETGQEVAIKTIKKSKIETEADLIRIRREVQIMSSVQHPNIIHIYEVFENREKMVLVMEFAAGGELYDYLSERKVLAEEEARRIFRQVSTAIYYCHKHKICHRDLKLENILLDEHGNAKIADFGLSNVFDEQRLLATFCGSPLYASPEIVKGTPYLGPEVDCWSLGVLLYTLVYGAMPFDGANFKRLVKQISQGDYFEPKKPSRASPLIREMLTVSPQRRANIEQICNHWWVNEGYQESCLDLAEELANQTPVRLDVLLSLAPPSVTSDQLVVGNNQEESKPKERIQRSRSVGSIIDMGSTEAERRILDMVAAGGEAALMPSPTRTITPAESSPAQPKRKLEPTVSTENATGAVKKKEKAAEKLKSDLSYTVIPEVMDVETPPSPGQESEPVVVSAQTKPEPPQQETDAETPTAAIDVLEDLLNLENMCDELLQETATPPTSKASSPEDSKQPTTTAVEVEPIISPPPKVESPPKTVAGVKAQLEKIEKADKPTDKVPMKKVFNKNKTADLASAINQVSKQDQEFAQVKSASNLERKNSLPEENLTKTSERRKSRILETAEKFQNLNNQNNDKFKKFSLPGIPTVGNYKKEFERKTSMSNSSSAPFRPSPYEMQRMTENEFSSPERSRQNSFTDLQTVLSPSDEKIVGRSDSDELRESDSRSSIGKFSLEEARKSMENSIALLNRVRTEPSSVDQLCAKTQNVSMTEETERERKLKNAREIIGNAIPIGRLRKPPMPFGANGRATTTGGLGLSSSSSGKPFRSDFVEPKLDTMSVPRKVSVGSISTPPADETKTSHAEITLKSATLPRRKLGKPDSPTSAKVDVPSPTVPPLSTMRFSTEMQHQIPDLRSAPIREHPIAFTVQQRANSLEPQGKEHTIPIQKPPTYQRTAPNAQFGGAARNSLSRQSTNESNDSDVTPSQSGTQMPHVPGGISANSSGTTMPIKKSPREFIIPIAVEGGGIVTPRANSLEPSESNLTTGSTGFGSKSRLGRPRKIGSLLGEREPEEESAFPRLNRHTSLGRESDSEEPRFHTMHRLRSSRPSKRGTAEPNNDSASSGEEDDDDGFEILTAENLFSTLLSRVRALTNRLNVTEPSSTGFPSSRFMSNLRQTQPFWHHHDPFSNRLNGGNTSSWRHSMSRDLSSDIDSMFSRSGATLPRGSKIYKPPYSSNSDVTNHNKYGSFTGNNLNNNVYEDPINMSSNNINDSYPVLQNNSNSHSTNILNNNYATHEQSPISNGEEVLDLGDLDLSQLKLTKKDLEALSSITPALSQSVQEQLLAQLPPQQAKKLSRTLSMQNRNSDTANHFSSNSKLFKRSFSNNTSRATTDSVDLYKSSETRDSLTPTNDLCESGVYHQRRLPKSDRSSRSSSTSRDLISPPPLPPPNFNEDFSVSSSSRFPYANESHERIRSYEKYTPYLSSNKFSKPEHERCKSLEYEKQLSFESQHPPGSSCSSPPVHERYGRPPSGYTSPPPVSSYSSGYSSQRSTSGRRISRFLRPDFFDPPKDAGEETADRMRREQETQKVLKEIREQSRDRSVERFETSMNKSSDRLTYFMEKYRKEDLDSVKQKRHSVYEKINTGETSQTDSRNMRSLSRSREAVDTNLSINDKNDSQFSFSDRILDELQSLGIMQQVTHDTKPAKSKSKDNITDIETRKTSEGTTASNNCSKCKNSIQPQVEESADDPLNLCLDEPLTEPIIGSSTTKVIKVKKVKIKPKLDAEGNPVTVTVKKVKKIIKPTSENSATETSKLVNDEQKSDDSKSKTVKKESKLIRPKSYPSKEPETSLTADTSYDSAAAINQQNEDSYIPECNTKNTFISASSASKIARPKSFPSSKLTPPKEVKLLKNHSDSPVLSAIVEKQIQEKPEDASNLPQSSNSTSESTQTSKQTETVSTSEIVTRVPGTTKKVRKVIRVVKKTAAAKSDSSTKSGSEEKSDAKKTQLSNKTPESRESPKPVETKETKTKRVEIVSPEPKQKSKSPEKKVKQGFLASIGQKFEKLRDASKLMKDKKVTQENGVNEASKQEDGEKVAAPINKEKKKSQAFSNDTTLADDTSMHEEEKTNRKSRIDQVIRNLRELSVPRAPILTESNLIKRAVSVEEMPDTFNKCSVNKVLGLFKKIEKDSKTNKVLNTKSSSHIDTMADVALLNVTLDNRNSNIRVGNCKIGQSVQEEDRAKSGNFTSKIRKPYSGTKSDTVLTVTEQECKSTNLLSVNCHNDVYLSHIPVKYSCPDCYKQEANKDQFVRRQSTITDEARKLSLDEKERVKSNRRALTLDFSKLDDGCHAKSINNNYSYPPPLPNGISNSTSTTNNNYTMNMNTLTPSYDSIINYSSGSRSSPYDDCNSSSTFMSPSEEPEFYYDNWSICSDDHNNMLSASPSMSRLSRLTYLNSISPIDNDSESVIERIRRKSFYTRFNENKPKRVSTVVGSLITPKEYQRDQSLSRSGQLSTRLKEYGKSSSSPVASAFAASGERSKNNYDHYYRSLTRTPSTNKSHKYAGTNDQHSKSTALGDSDLYHHHHHQHYYHLPISNSSRKLNFSSNDSSDNLNNYNTIGRQSTSRNTFYESSSPLYYATYNPRRRSSCVTAANLTSSSSSIALDNAAASTSTVSTATENDRILKKTSSTTTSSSSTPPQSLAEGIGGTGRKLRPYETRSISSLNPSGSKESRYGAYDNSGATRTENRFSPVRTAIYWNNQLCLKFGSKRRIRTQQQ
ncbi:serine-rich adhesin for platelets isoform X4 [Uranotaenia lowii]|uniref:serine-rich adhesin for platelets isoform X4 n=1 Tax=Uranotaenia lowii TaxID=190385 RepID=UPI00247AD091|nr:serine-rich adhesin for platelets isoform X4 [Uranotaenia lowii]